MLVVDDDAEMLSLLGDYFRGAGFECHTSHRWDNALALTREVRPHLVVLDLMWGQSAAGWRVLDTLQLDPLTDRIPVILCSGAADSIQARLPALMPRYAVYVLPKPFDIPALDRVVAKALRLPKSPLERRTVST